LGEEWSFELPTVTDPEDADHTISVSILPSIGASFIDFKTQPDVPADRLEIDIDS
jgi:hypothetical protein